MVVSIPMRLPSLANLRLHWAARAKLMKSQRTATFYSLFNHNPPGLPCSVTITRVAPRPLDDDNATISAKAIRDEIARWLGVDDRDARVTWRVTQAKGPYAVTVSIETTKKGETP